jgi:hypothetical protein
MIAYTGLGSNTAAPAKRAPNMSQGVEAVRWARRVSRAKIRQLYNTYASGIIDEELIDEVAYGFYARCESILTIRDAKRGRVKCPCCEHVIARDRKQKNDTIACDGCGWTTTWHEYCGTFRRRQLHFGGAADVFEGFVNRLPAARTPDEKMRLIDWLMHECHKMQDHATGERFPTRPVAPNLIRGNLTQCMALLDELAYGPSGTTETKSAQTAWNQRVLAGREQLRAQVRSRKAARAARPRRP